MTDAPPTRGFAVRLVGLLDLTSLDPTDDAAAIRRLSVSARTPLGDVAAVCTWPTLIGVAAQALEGAGVGLAAVANFPGGDDPPDAVEREIEGALAEGADEIDVVLPFRRLLAGDEAAARGLVRTARAACGGRARLKVILETGQLADPSRIRRAGALAIAEGADMLKTSTGKTEPGATVAAATAVLAAIAEARRSGSEVGFKVSGGVRTVADAKTYLDLFERTLDEPAIPARFRIGASGLLTEVLRLAET